VRARLTWVAFGLASLLCAWGAYVHGSQLIEALTLAWKIDDPVPEAFWVLIGLYAVHTIGVCAGWWVGYLGMTTQRYRQAAIGLAVALVACSPLLIVIFTRINQAA
jgi:hypothetical protein